MTGAHRVLVPRPERQRDGDPCGHWHQALLIASGYTETVVIWELSGTGEDRQRRGLHLIGYAFAALALYLLIQSTLVLAAGFHPRHSPLGIAWTAATAIAMFALAAGKARTGRELDNSVLRTEGRVTTIDGIPLMRRSQSQDVIDMFAVHVPHGMRSVERSPRLLVYGQQYNLDSP